MALFMNEKTAQQRRPEVVRVCIVEDNHALRESLCLMISTSHGFEVAGSYSNGQEAIQRIPDADPHLVIMDINLPDVSGIECVSRLRSLVPGLLMVMLTVHEETETIFQALQAGAHSYLVKSTPPIEIIQALSEVAKGGSPMSADIARKVINSFHRKPKPKETRCASLLNQLSPREKQILEMLSRGYLYKEISERLNIKFETVHTHIRNIYEKLQVHSRSQAVNKLMQQQRHRRKFSGI